MAKFAYRRFSVFKKRFSTEEACEKYLINYRWSKGFKCPICGDKEFYWIRSKRALQCKTNRHQTYLTAGTVMHRTRTPLRIWFWASYLFITGKRGISAFRLHQRLGIRYETAWQILHKLRASMANPLKDKIGGGDVEVDQFYIRWQISAGKRGKKPKDTRVIVAVENRENDAGRMRLKKIKDVSKSYVTDFVQDNIEPESTIEIDKWFLENIILKESVYKHKRISECKVARSVISDLKTWLKETFYGVSRKHLQAYLNEYAFRFNMRFYPNTGFQTILGLSSKVKFPTYEGLYSGWWKHPYPKGLASKREGKTRLKDEKKEDWMSDN